MGELPRPRVDVPIRPFQHCGTEFAGPLYYKENVRRNAKLLKMYTAVFVCFASKAVHIELSADLTSETFLNVLKRFIARRGRPTDIYSDNATNFFGAKNELFKLRKMFLNEQNKTKIYDFAANGQINWHFIPPHAPYFGGLWEAAVKSAKRSLYHVARDASLRFNELMTLLTQVETILNSRPICSLSEDPNDLQPLTPAHFLIGAPLTSFPEPSLTQLPSYRLSRWQHVEQIRQHFWKRWLGEYLHTLQQHIQWNKNSPNLRPGKLVILK